MLRAGVLALLFASIAVYAVEVEEEDDVKVLTVSNFDQFIAENELTLVEFYAPWCGHCKNLAPHYAKAAATLKGDDTVVPLAKVDATAERGLGDRYGVKGFPTLKFFRNGKATEYDGGRTESEIVSWIRKRSGPAAKTIETGEQADSFSAGAEVAVFGVFASVDSAEYKAFMSAAGSVDDVAFAVSTNSAVATKFGVTAPAVVLIKAFDEGRVDLTSELSADSITTFVNSNKLPLVMEFTQAAAPKIFGGDVKLHLLTFVNKGEAHFEGVKAALTEIAPANKGRILHIYVPHTESRVMGYFGFEEGDLPAAVLVNMAEEGMKKYALSGEVNAANLKNLVEDYAAGKLKPFLKSAEVPAESHDSGVRVLVGKNFDEVALDSKKDVMVEFYAPWCGHCKSLAPKYEALAATFKDVSSVVIAKMDATENEVDVEGVSVRGFPTLYFFPAGGEPILYNGGREEDDMADFILENAAINFSLDGVKGGPEGKDEL